MSTQVQQLYRSRENRMVGGVCAGMGKFFGIDPTLVRLGFVAGALLGGAGALGVAYIVMMVVVPEEPLSTPTVEPSIQAPAAE